MRNFVGWKGKLTFQITLEKNCSLFHKKITPESRENTRKCYFAKVFPHPFAWVFSRYLLLTWQNNTNLYFPHTYFLKKRYIDSHVATSHIVLVWQCPFHGKWKVSFKFVSKFFLTYLLATPSIKITN